jgi:glycosyltransferase involved in cell wall biosynthesis
MEREILIIIPAYNEENNIGLLLKKISKFYPLKDVLIVDDGSIDNTSSIAKEAKVNVIIQPKNLGKGMALKRGFEYGIEKGYKAVITMDADLQHNPEEIPKFLKAFKENGDLIIGTRNPSLKEMPLVRFLVNHTTSLVTSLLSCVRVRDSQSGYRLLSTDLLSNLSIETYRFQTETEIIVKAVRSGYKVKEIPIGTLYLKNTKSHINPVIDTVRFILLSIRLLWR